MCFESRAPATRLVTVANLKQQEESDIRNDSCTILYRKASSHTPVPTKEQVSRYFSGVGVCFSTVGMANRLSTKL